VNSSVGPKAAKAASQDELAETPRGQKWSVGAVVVDGLVSNGAFARLI
jgi:hypothetical protein